MICPKCGKDMAEGSIVCPYCLANTVKLRRNKVIRTVLLVIAAIVIVVLAAAALITMTGCSVPLNENMNEVPVAAQDDLTAEDADGQTNAVSDTDELIVYDSDNGAYAGSPILGTWILLEDYEDGYDNWDNVAEYTGDGFVYEWYGDGLGYYDPLCCFDYDGNTLVYHYYASFGAPEDYDISFECDINGDRMITTDANGVSSEFIRVSEKINLSVEQLTELYK